MIYINLLPIRANQKREKLLEQSIIFGVAVALVLAACIGVYLVLLSKVLLENNEIAKKQKQSQALQGQISEVKNFEKMQKDLKVKLDILDKLKLGRTGPVHLLDELANSVPKTLWLETFKDLNGELTVTGQAINEESIAVFMQKLEDSPYIQNVELKVIDQTVKSKVKVKKFEITCKKEVTAAVNHNKNTLESP